MIIRPGSVFEMVPEVINGREYKVWKNVRLLLCLKLTESPSVHCAPISCPT